MEKPSIIEKWTQNWKIVEQKLRRKAWAVTKVVDKLIIKIKWSFSSGSWYFSVCKQITFFRELNLSSSKSSNYQWNNRKCHKNSSKIDRIIRSQQADVLERASSSKATRGSSISWLRVRIKHFWRSSTNYWYNSAIIVSG